MKKGKKDRKVSFCKLPNDCLWLTINSDSAKRWITEQTVTSESTIHSFKHSMYSTHSLSISTPSLPNPIQLPAWIAELSQQFWLMWPHGLSRRSFERREKNIFITDWWLCTCTFSVRLYYAFDSIQTSYICTYIWLLCIAESELAKRDTCSIREKRKERREWKTLQTKIDPKEKKERKGKPFLTDSVMVLEK